MRRGLLAIALVLPLLAPAAASAQVPCSPVRVLSFTIPEEIVGGSEQAVRVGEHTPLEVLLSAPARGVTVSVAWGDGTVTRARSGRYDVARARHVYTRAGLRRIVATATSACGVAAGALTLRIHPRCTQDRGPTVTYADCDPFTGRLSIGSEGRWAQGTWIDSPCNDNGSVATATPAEPVARAATCVVPVDWPTVSGAVPIRPRGRLVVRLGARADSVVVRLGRHRLRAVPGDAAGRRFTVVLPRDPGPVTRVHLRVRRGGEGDDWVAGVRPT